MNLKVRRVDIALGVSILLLTIATIVLIVALSDKEEEEDTTIIVDEVYFVVESESASKTRIKIVLFVSNTGDEDIRSLSVRAFSVETDSNLAKYDASREIKDVKAKTTAEGNLTIIVPNRDNYRVEILVFRDGKLDLRGSGTIDLTTVGIATDYRTYPDKDAENGAYPMADTAASAGGLTLVCLFLIIPIGILALIIFIGVIAKKSKTEQDKVPGSIAKDLFGNGFPHEIKEGHQDEVPPEAYMDHEPEEEEREQASTSEV